MEWKWRSHFHLKKKSENGLHDTPINLPTYLLEKSRIPADNRGLKQH